MSTLNVLAYIYQSMPKISILFFAAMITLLIAIFAVNLIVFKKIDILSIILFISSFVCLFLNQSIEIVLNGLIIFIYLVSFLRVSQMIYRYLCIDACKQKVDEHLKNDTIDFFITMDKKNRILSSSISFAQLTKLTKKEIEKKNGWNLMFDSLNIQKINGEEFITSNKELFISHLDEVLSKYKMYEFTLDIKQNNQEELIRYNGYIQAIYLKDKKIGTAVYLYSDKQNIIVNIKNKLDYTINNLYNHKNVLHILMSLSEGVALYYDYQEKLFYATQSFMEFVGLEKESYTFKEFYEMIVEEDKDIYNEQSATVNSISPTRIKIRLKINNIYFNAIEDAVFLTRDGEEYVSIIHIISRCDESLKNRILSTKESVDMISGLSETPIAPVVYKVEELLSGSLKDDINEE